MVEQGRIQPTEGERARAAPLGVARRRVAGDRPVFAGYFIEEVRRQLEDVMGGDLYDQRLRIRTTLDSNAQRAAEEELARQLHAIEGGALGGFRRRDAPLQGAVVMMGAVEGDVLAWVGGRDFNESRFDRVRGARRQAGSAFKPFVYAAALDIGHTLSDPLSDEPLRLDQGGRHFWEPHNFDDQYDGQVTVREALVRSKNVPTVRLAQEIGTHAVAAFARDAGIEQPISEEPSMALGTVAVSPLELTAAYTAFATLGTGVKPRVIVQVEDPDKEVVWSSEVETRRVLQPAIAFLVNDALRDALLRGTGQAVRQAGFQGVAAGKTGTTNDGTDAWFVGYDPQVVAAVWIGFDRPQPIMAKATGGRLAAPAWARIMERFYAGRSRPRPWPQPDGIVAASVDPGTGMVLAPGCLPLSAAPYRELFVSSRIPRETCPTRGDLPTVEPFSDYPEMDEEVAEAPPEPYEPAALAPVPEEVEAEEEEQRAAATAPPADREPKPPAAVPTEPAPPPPAPAPARAARPSPGEEPEPRRPRGGADRRGAAARAAQPGAVGAAVLGLHSQPLEKERQDVDLGLDALVERGPEPVSAGRARPQQHRARPGRLEPRRHLARLHGIHARVVGPGQEEHRGVAAAVLHAVIGRVGVKGPELIGVLHRAVFRDVEGAVRGELDAQHVVDPRVRDHGAEQIGPLR
jgi:penicillin-binding protein 1A